MDKVESEEPLQKKTLTEIWYSEDTTSRNRTNRIWSRDFQPEVEQEFSRHESGIE